VRASRHETGDGRQGTEPSAVRQGPLRPTKNSQPRTSWLFVAVAVLAVVSPTGAVTGGRQFNSPTLLFDTPTADVLPAGALAISVDVTYPLTNTTHNVNYPEADASIRFSPLKHLDFAVTAYTFVDYVLDAKYQILGGGDPGKCGLAVGVYDVGLYDYVSPIGHDTANAWPDWKYEDRTTERFSAFVVTSIPVKKFARLNLGLGRGRFVGYADHSKYFNSDIFFAEHHQWAIALFGGVEIYVHPKVALVAEANSRDMNTGVKANFGPLTAAVAWTKMEGLIFAEGEPNGTPKFGRLEAGITYRFSDLSGLAGLFRCRERECAPMEPIPPPPEPIVVPTGPDPRAHKFELLPIYFDLDRPDIRSGDAEILRQNAATILARQKAGLKAGVIIEGHTCPFASEVYNVGLGARRAESARAHLVGLGVDDALLTTQTFGETNPPYRDTAEYYLDRRCEFKWKY